MATKVKPDRHGIPGIEPAGGTASIEAAKHPRLTEVQRFLKVFGPGLITGASDDDPSGVGTYALAGATYGFQTLWMALVTFPMMAAVQFMCAKIGMVSGRGLAGVVKANYSKRLLYTTVIALVVANTINAGADLGAIAAGINLIAPVPIRVLILPVAAAVIALQVLGSYRLIANIFKWLSLALLAYVLSAFFSKPNIGDVLRGTFLPSLAWNKDFLAMTVGILGTTISPYMFFWQSNQEVEEEIAAGRKTLRQRRGATKAELRYAAIDVNIGMLLSNVVMYFIILSTAATLFAAGKRDIQTAAEAAVALRPLAGKAAEMLLAVGLIGTGFLAVPILTGSSAYAVAEAFGWEHGLDKKPHSARAFYWVIAGATVVGALMNFVGINPVKALFVTAVINGLLAPPLLFLILRVSNSRKIMGERVNGRVLNVLGWVTAVAMSAAAVALVVTWVW
jgi:NRAMP (natural resistance-associated macrophage protein)-like metal ion transporter